MRADRLVSLVLLLRQRGRLTAGDLAEELEVSVRTVLRDIDALSTAGVPVYAERGRHGGFALLPGFRTELTGLSHEEALALLTVTGSSGEQVFGLNAALAGAMRKVVDALPVGQRAGLEEMAHRFLVEPESDLLSRRVEAEAIPEQVMSAVRLAVVRGRRLRISYAAAGQQPAWRTVDPLGLVTVRARTYLLATRDGQERTYRLTRMLQAEPMNEAAQRPAQVDLDRLWRDRVSQFLSEDHLSVQVRVAERRREELLGLARGVRAEERDDSERDDGRDDSKGDSTVVLTLAFEDQRHALWALWQLGTDAEVLEPESLRDALGERAAALLARYRQGPAVN